MNIQIRHIGVVVFDIEKTLGFYRDMLGFSIVRDTEEYGGYIDTLLGEKGASVRTVKLSSGSNTLIELLYFSSPSAEPGQQKVCTAGFSHIALTVEKIDAAYKKLQQKGIVFISAPQVSPDRRAKVVFCRDPEGNLVELVEGLK